MVIFIILRNYAITHLPIVASHSFRDLCELFFRLSVSSSARDGSSTQRKLIIIHVDLYAFFLAIISWFLPNIQY